jgi:hypothetical protein
MILSSWVAHKKMKAKIDQIKLMGRDTIEVMRSKILKFFNSEVSGP